MVREELRDYVPPNYSLIFNWTGNDLKLPQETSCHLFINKEMASSFYLLIPYIFYLISLWIYRDSVLTESQNLWDFVLLPS